MEETNDTVVETTDDSKKEEVVEETKVEEKKEETPDLEAENARLKRELKQTRKKLEDTSKPKEEEKPKTSKKSDEEFGLLELTYLKGEEIKGDDEIEFVRKELKEAGLTKDQLPKLFSNKYFQSELKSFRDDKASTEATSDVKGGGGEGKATSKSEYWIAKGAPPTREQVPDNKLRRQIVKDFIAAAKSGGKTFYND